MSIFKYLISGLAAGILAISGYDYYTKHYVVTPAQTPAAVSSEPKGMAPVKQEEILPRIFGEQKQSLVEEPVKAVPAPVVPAVEPVKPKVEKKAEKKAEKPKTSRSAVREAGDVTKRALGDAIDDIVDSVETTTKVVVDTGKTVNDIFNDIKSRFKCTGDQEWKTQKDCRWVRDLWSETGIGVSISER